LEKEIPTVLNLKRAKHAAWAKELSDDKKQKVFDEHLRLAK
jgi:hypothetical protein